MSSVTSAAGAKPHLLVARRSRSGLRYGLIIGALLILGFLATLIYVQVWPFSRKEVLQDLAQASDSSVTVQRFHKTHFPPGCVLEGVEFRHGDEGFKLITIEKLIIEGSYTGSLRHHVRRITAVGARVYIPPFGGNFQIQGRHSGIVIDEVIANGTGIEFLSSDRQDPLLFFEVHEARLHQVQWGHPIAYDFRFRNPDPPGEISVHGDFGAWTTGHPGDTPISGEYTFEHADLSVYGGIGGLLRSKGSFSGPLQHVHVTGTTDTPDFVVKSGGHKVDLSTRFDAFEDGIHGDTFLNHVEARLGRTTLIAEGSVARMAGKRGKVTNLRITSRHGRIEDLLGLFVSAPRSPMSGDVSLGTQAQLVGGDAPFLNRVKLDGGFGIDAGKFSNQNTQKDVDTLSAGARGANKEDPETVLSDLKGKVTLIDGTAHFSNLSFGVPGANARMQGTYQLISHKVNLHGKMSVDTQISKTSSGVKSLLLKFMEPFFTKKKKGEIVPVHIQGTYEKPEFGLDVGQK